MIALPIRPLRSRVALAVALPLLLAPASSAMGELGGFALVRDLETAPNHLWFTGYVFEGQVATLAYAHRTLWRLEGPSGSPTPLVRDIWNPTRVQDLGGGSFAAPGVEVETGEVGLWVTDGGPPRKIAPPGFPGQGPWAGPTVARQGDVFFSKTLYSWTALGDGFWRLEEGTDPLRLGPSGAYGVSSDPSFPLLCAGVLPTPSGVLHCRWASGEAELWLSDGKSETQVPGLLVSDLTSWTKYSGATYAVASTSSEAVLVRTNGTVAGTETVDTIRGRASVLEGALVWLRREENGEYAVRTTDGTEPPSSFATIPSGANLDDLGVAAGRLYFQALTTPAAGCDLRSASPSGEVTTIDTGGRCPSSTVVDAPILGGGLVFLKEVSEPKHGLFLVSPGGVEPIEPAADWGPPEASPELASQDGDPFVPWLDPSGRSRIAKVGPGGIEPRDELRLVGTAGSRAEVLGELGGETVIFADTALEGPTLWRSRGTPHTTRPIEPPLVSRCRGSHYARPRLVAPDTVVDCEGEGGGTRVWVFSGLDAHQEVELDLGVEDQWFEPAVGRLPGYLLHNVGLEVHATSLAGGPSVSLIGECPAPEILTLSSRALVACSNDRVYTTDGSLAGTQLLLDLPQHWDHAALVRVGNQAGISHSDESWLSDGTAPGTVSLGALSGISAARLGSDWTCAWSPTGTIHRLALASGEIRPLAETGSSLIVLPTPAASGSVHPLGVLGAEGFELWRCDGTRDGTRRLAALPWNTPYPSSGLVALGGRVWGHHASDGYERVLGVSLEDGSIEEPLHRRIHLADERLGLPSSLPYPPLRVSAGLLWTTLADQEHGREPRVLRIPGTELFADGFESADLSRWSASSP